jgi:hypothetical protein
MRRTRTRFRALLLAAVLSAVPVGFGLSFEVEPGAADGQRAVVATAVSVPAAHSLLRGAPDATILLALGTVLLGLAAAVRKTT